MSSQKSRVLYTRDAYHILLSQLHLWALDCNASIVSSPGLGNYSKGNGVDKNGRSFHSMGHQDTDVDASEFPDPKTLYSDEPPQIPNGGGLDDNLTGGVFVNGDVVLGTYALITLEKAVLWMKAEFSTVARKVHIVRRRAEVPGKHGRFRAWLHWHRATIRLEVFLRIGIERMKAACLTQSRRPRGSQPIDTRKKINAPYFKTFFFNGKPAMRFAPGQVPLPADEWLRRYRARKDAARKTNRRRLNDKRKTVRVPATRHGRPDRILNPNTPKFDKPQKLFPSFSHAEYDAEPILAEFRAEMETAIG